MVKSLVDAAYLMQTCEGNEERVQEAKKRLWNYVDAWRLIGAELPDVTFIMDTMKEAYHVTFRGEAIYKASAVKRYVYEKYMNGRI
jgi:hypothetical protein|nr:MAG TPA: hypothetical protein [Caudoviricetes sp.]